ncbi:hypothetical protein [Oscillibacter sp.]|uniref:hypothetical protein n=1 Tax=Oscillibacter sp. TaxID=1945593 RepID=UPI00289F212C|nr:hypothetical protein [Oscillibacter sp.]
MIIWRRTSKNSDKPPPVFAGGGFIPGAFTAGRLFVDAPSCQFNQTGAGREEKPVAGLPDTAGSRGAFLGLYSETTVPKQKTGKRSYTRNFINLSGYKSGQATSPIAGKSLPEYILKLAPPDELCYNKKRLF